MKGQEGGDYGMPVSASSLEQGFIKLDSSIEALTRKEVTNANGDSWPRPSPNVMYGEAMGWEPADGYFDPDRAGGFLGRKQGGER